MTDVTPEYYTVDEVADIYRVTGMTIRRMIGDGDLPAIKIGRSWRIPASAVIRAQSVAQRTGQQAPGAEFASA